MFGKGGKYQKPFYEDPDAYKYAGIMSLAGCVLMVLATFLHWRAMFVKYTETKLSGFGIFSSVRRGLETMVVRDYAGKVVERNFSIHGIFPLIMLIIYVAYILFMAYVSYMYHMQENDIFDKGRDTIFTRRKKTVRVIMIIVSIIILIVQTHTKMFREQVSDDEQLYNNWIAMIEMSRNSGVKGAQYMTCIKLMGFGKILYVLGLLLYIGSYVYRYVVDTLNEDSENQKKTSQLDISGSEAETPTDIDSKEPEESSSPFDTKPVVDEDLFNEE